MQNGFHSDQEDMVKLTLSDKELEMRKLESRTIEKALEALHRDGVVVVTNAISKDMLDFYNARMIKDAEKYIKTIKKDEDFNFGSATGNFQMSPPLNTEFTQAEIMYNPFVVGIAEACLGPKPVLRFWSSNAALGPAKSSQPVHTDANHKHLNIPFGLIANINCVSTSVANGATELWPGTHVETADAQDPADKDSFNIRKDYLARVEKVRPPLQPSLPKGSVIIRDIRMWHAGKPNTTSDPRIMLSLFYSAAWYRSHLQITLPNSCKKITDSWSRIQVACDWKPDPVDHLVPEICHSDTDFSENRHPNAQLYLPDG